MMLFDRKQAITTMMAKRNGQGERTHDPVAMKPEVVKDEQGEIDGRHVAMQDFLAAHKEGSPDKMMQALSNFLEIHNSGSGSVGASEVPSSE